MKLCTLLVQFFVNFVTLNTASHLQKFKSPAPSISKHEHAGSCIVPTHTRFLPLGLERKPMSMLCRMTSIVHLSHNARIISFSPELTKNHPLLLDIVRQRIFSTINPPSLYVILTVYTTLFHLHSHCLTIEQVCFLLREE
jgi:hypothetical protein